MIDKSVSSNVDTTIDMSALEPKQSSRSRMPIEYEATPASVKRRLENVLHMKDSIVEYRKLESLDMSNVKLQALDMLTHPGRLAEASFDELMRLVKLTNDRQQLLDGKPQTTHGALIAHIVKAAEMREIEVVEEEVA